MELVVATTNPGKLREIRRVLAGTGVRLIDAAGAGAVSEPEETGRTFVENAWIKARHYAAAAGRPTVAEDSGLAIDALGGRPGIASARYPGADYPAKFAGLYAELAPHPRPWTARFVCAVVVIDGADPAGAARFTCEATVEGEIAPAPRGPHGFGYDPVFLYSPWGLTFGEVPDAQKLEVAHRGRAFRRLARWLQGGS